MSTDQHETSRRGRRSTDWTLKRLITIGTLLTMLGAAYTAFAARWATKAEVTEAVRPVTDTLKAMSRRLDRVEQRQDSAQSIADLVIANARFNCLVAERDHSTSLTEAAGFKCNVLLGRVR